MFFTRALTFAVVATLGLLAAAAPAPAADQEQSAATLNSVLANLQSTTSTVLPQLSALGASGQITEENATPLINQLTTAVTNANNALAVLSPLQTSDSDTANQVSNMITEITNTLHGLPFGRIPALLILFAELQAALNRILLTLDFLLIHLIFDVSFLLHGIVGLLNDIGFGLLIGVLGL